MKDYLSLSHLFKYLNVVVMSLIKSMGLELVSIILVSSASRICLDLFLEEFGKSLFSGIVSTERLWNICRDEEMIMNGK